MLLAALGSALAVAVLLAPTILGAQPGLHPRIGILSTTAPLRGTPTTTAFIKRLADLGYVEGRNLTIEFRYADDKPARLPELARELVRLRPDVILAMGTQDSALAIMSATTKSRSCSRSRSIPFEPGSSRAWRDPGAMSPASPR
jgi:putative ABC transport system substrate-binding protein